MAKKKKQVEVEAEDVQEPVESVDPVVDVKKGKFGDPMAGFLDKQIGKESDPGGVVDTTEAKSEPAEDDVGISESLDLANFSALVNENGPATDSVEDTGGTAEFDSMDDDKKQEYAQNDPAVSVDVSQLKDSNKKSIYDLIGQRDLARTQSKSLEKKIADLEKALDSRPTDSKIEEFQGQVNELTNRLGYYEVSETPEFMREVQEPRDEIKQTLYDISIQFGIEQAEVEKSISLPTKQRLEFLRDNYPDFLASAGHHLAVLDRIAVKEKRLRNDHPKIIDEHKRTVELERERATAVGKKQQNDKLAYMLGRSIESAQQNNVPYFVKNGEEGHDVLVEEVFGKSKEVVMSNDPNEILGYAVLGASVPAYHKELHKAMARIKELEGKVGKMGKASPGVSGKSPSEPTGQTKPSSYSEFMDQAVA